MFDIDQVRLRMFLLSLLWRAAATDRVEFSEVKISATDVERLGTLLLTADPGPIDFYPAVLTQLSTKGRIHNHAPIAEMKNVPPLLGRKGHLIPIFRFYIDGLVIHFHRDSSGGGGVSSLDDFVVGYRESLLVTTQAYEASFQKANFEFVQRESLPVQPDLRRGM